MPKTAIVAVNSVYFTDTNGNKMRSSGQICKGRKVLTPKKMPICPSVGMLRRFIYRSNARDLLFTNVYCMQSIRTYDNIIYY